MNPTLESLHVRLADQYRANAANDRRIAILWAQIDALEEGA